MMGELKPGDRVLYVPSTDHWHEGDARGQPLFEFVLTEDGPAVAVGGTRARKGDRALASLLARVERRDVDGTLHTSEGYALRPARALSAWPALCRLEDGRLVLDVRHPGGTVILHLPLQGLGAPPHDPAGGPHTWHRLEEGEHGS
jgi:hypothetical protein